MTSENCADFVTVLAGLTGTSVDPLGFTKDNCCYFNTTIVQCTLPSSGPIARISLGAHGLSGTVLVCICVV
jgi:hypothetical protein